jgi:hypothetical protein
VPRIPGERFLPAPGDHREALADWITSKDHRRFARAQVNRLWQSLFGRGLIEPIDDLRDTNPPTHPVLLDRLADDLIFHQYDLRHTLRLLANSGAYQRSSQPPQDAPSDDRFYSHALRRTLSPEVLLDTIGDAVGVPSQFRDVQGELLGTRAIGLFAPHLASSMLGPLAVCDQRGGCVAAGEATASLDDLDVQLHWINGPLVNARLSHLDSELARIARTKLSSRKLLDEYYLRTLCRRPREAEVEFWLPKLQGTSRHKKCEDLAWALLSCQEFTTNH